MVLKVLLALRKLAARPDLHLVAELLDERTEPVARMVAGDAAALVLTGPLVSRLLVQTGRQPGLSDVYGELLDFAGSEIYLTSEPRLAGERFRDAVHRYGSSTLLGVVTADGTLLLPPDLDRPFEAGDRVVAISEDDDTVVLDGTRTVDESAIAVAAASAATASPRTSPPSSTRRSRPGSRSPTPTRSSSSPGPRRSGPARRARARPRRDRAAPARPSAPPTATSRPRPPRPTAAPAARRPTSA